MDSIMHTAYGRLTVREGTLSAYEPCSTDLVLHWDYGEKQTECDSRY